MFYQTWGVKPADDDGRKGLSNVHMMYMVHMLTMHDWWWTTFVQLAIPLEIATRCSPNACFMGTTSRLSVERQFSIVNPERSNIYNIHMMCSPIHLQYVIKWYVPFPADAALHVGNTLCYFSFQLSGDLDDCSCTVESIDSFNNVKIHPRLSRLLTTDYFKYYKVSHRLTVLILYYIQLCAAVYSGASVQDQSRINSRTTITKTTVYKFWYTFPGFEIFC